MTSSSRSRANLLPTPTDSDRVHSLIRIRLFLFRLIDHAILGNPFPEGDTPRWNPPRLDTTSGPSHSPSRDSTEHRCITSDAPSRRRRLAPCSNRRTIPPFLTTSNSYVKCARNVLFSRGGLIHFQSNFEACMPMRSERSATRTDAGERNSSCAIKPLSQSASLCASS